MPHCGTECCKAEILPFGLKFLEAQVLSRENEPIELKPVCLHGRRIIPLVSLPFAEIRFLLSGTDCQSYGAAAVGNRQRVIRLRADAVIDHVLNVQFCLFRRLKRRNGAVIRDSENDFPSVIICEGADGFKKFAGYLLLEFKLMVFLHFLSLQSPYTLIHYSENKRKANENIYWLIYS